MARESSPARSERSSHSHSHRRRHRSRSRSPRRESRSSRYEDERYSSSRHSRDSREDDRDRRRHRDDDDRDRDRYRGREERERARRRSRSPSSRKRDRDHYDDEDRRKERKRDSHDSPRSSRRERDERPRSRERERRPSKDEPSADMSRHSSRDTAPASVVQEEEQQPSALLTPQQHQPVETSTRVLPPAPAVIEESEEERKIRERQEKLAAWKAKKAQQASTPPRAASPAVPSALSTKPAKPSKLNPNIGARLGLPSKATSERANLMLGEDDEDDKRTMFRPDADDGAATAEAPAPADDGDESSDDELARDDATGVVERRQRSDVAMEEDAKPATNGTTEPEPAKVEADDDDELEAYMMGITKEVKRVNEADVARGLYVPRGISKLGMDDSKEEAAPEEEEKEEPDPDAELENTSLRAEDILALAAKKIKKKDMLVVDHSKIDYEPFRKSFYHPPPDIARMTEEEAADLRLQLDGIKIRGKDCPKPITKWSHCGLPAVCLDVIKDMGFEGPTPIQAQSIPAIMSGRDVIGVAKTGSGKTIAFLLPLFRHIKDQRPLSAHEGPIAMIMTPTRELAVQIHRECRPFLKALNLRAAVSYGGSPLKDNIADLKRGAEIVVCTPGRMIELLTTNSGKVVNLRRITYLVLDEADRMFDLGFEPQVMKIIGQTRPDRQTVLFSATFPKQMESLARKILVKPLELTVGGRSKVAAEIEQILEVREEDTKFNRLLELLGQFSNADADSRSLVFVDRQESADNLMRELIKKSYICQSLHGGKEQVDRDQVLSDFKSGSVSVVIATSVAARGLDVKQLKLVVNYDCPNHMEDYVHRAGRTGRAGNKGTCVTFITPEQERYSVDIVRAMEQSGVADRIPKEARDMSDRFLASLKKEGKSYTGGGGFGGKGLDKLDQERDQADRAQRVAYGEAPTETNSASLYDDDGELKPEVSLPGMDIEIKSGRAPENAGRPAAPPPSREQTAKLQGAAMDKAHAVAKNLSDSIRNRAPHLFMHDDRGSGYNSADPNAQDYHAIIPINDFPQKVRWRVTNKETMSMLTEQTGASVTNKGVFYAKGVDPGEHGIAKLHLLVEASTEESVKAAVNMLKRLLVEASKEALLAEANEPRGSGRYTV